MLIYANIDGITVPVQMVSRKDGTKYFRLAAEFWKPTPRQEAVRRNLSIAAYNQKEIDGYTTRERVNESVRGSFVGWVHSETKRKSKLQERIQEIRKLSIKGGVANAQIIETKIR